MKYLIMAATLIFSGLTYSFIESKSDTKQIEEEDHRTEVVLMGVWHFSNPAMDEYNPTVDNYFSKRRQQEIAELNNALATMSPDKIFVERDSRYQSYYDSLYQDPNFDPEKIPNNRGTSEVYQVGFKLGKILGHQKVYCADADGLWLGRAANPVAKEQYTELEKKESTAMTNSIKEDNEFYKKNSILDAVIRENHPATVLANHSGYIDYYARIIDQNQKESYPVYVQEIGEEKEERLVCGVDQKYVGAELVAEWYKRNIKIYSKIMENTTKEDKRIFVMFGAGHIHIIKQLFEDNPSFKVVEVNDFLDKQATK